MDELFDLFEEIGEKARKHVWPIVSITIVIAVVLVLGGCATTEDGRPPLISSGRGLQILTNGKVVAVSDYNPGQDPKMRPIGWESQLIANANHATINQPAEEERRTSPKLETANTPSPLALVDAVVEELLEIAGDIKTGIQKFFNSLKPG